MRVMYFVGACLALALGGVGPVAAQERASISEVAVRACFDKTPEGAGRIACRGEVGPTCRAPNGDTTSTIGTVACLQAELVAWDKILNEEYQRVQRANRDDDARGRAAGLSRVVTLRQAQRAWIAFRDAACSALYALWQDGTIRSVVAADCQVRLTAERAVELRDMRGF